MIVLIFFNQAISLAFGVYCQHKKVNSNIKQKVLDNKIELKKKLETPLQTQLLDDLHFVYQVSYNKDQKTADLEKS